MYATTKTGVVPAFDASELGWVVGVFHARLVRNGRVYLQADTERDRTGRVTSVLYVADGGYRIVVFND